MELIDRWDGLVDFKLDVVGAHRHTLVVAWLR